MDRARSPICSYISSGLGRRLLAVRVIYHREMNARDIMIVGGEKTDAIFWVNRRHWQGFTTDKNGNSHDDLFQRPDSRPLRLEFTLSPRFIKLLTRLRKKRRCVYFFDPQIDPRAKEL